MVLSFNKLLGFICAFGIFSFFFLKFLVSYFKHAVFHAAAYIITHFSLFFLFF